MNLFDIGVSLTIRAAGALAVVAAWHSPGPLLGLLFGIVGAAAVICPQVFVPQEVAAEEPVPEPTPEPTPQHTGWTVVRPQVPTWPATAPRSVGRPATWSHASTHAGGREDHAFGPVLSEPPHRRQKSRR